VIFKSDTAGWNALYHQIDKALSGDSKYYRQDMTLREVAKRYAANSTRWARNVARQLHVTPDTTLEEFFDIPPRINYAQLWTSNRAPLF
jgi:hypothetical protein